MLNKNIQELGIKKVKISDLHIGYDTNLTTRELYSSEDEIKGLKLLSEIHNNDRNFLGLIQLVKELDKKMYNRLHCGCLLDYRSFRGDNSDIDKTKEILENKMVQFREDVVHLLSIFFGHLDLTKSLLVPKKLFMKRKPPFSAKRLFEKKNKKDQMWGLYKKDFVKSFGKDYSDCVINFTNVEFIDYMSVWIQNIMDGYLTLISEKEVGMEDVSIVDNTCFVLSFIDFVVFHKNHTKNPNIEPFKSISFEELDFSTKTISMCGNDYPFEKKVNIEKIEQYKGKMLELLISEETKTKH